MSRIGKSPIKIQDKVKVSISGSTMNVEGPKGKLSFKLPEGVTANVEKDEVLVTYDESLGKKGSAFQGVSRTVIQNLVTGVLTGFTKELDIVGVGYRAAVKGDSLTLNLGFSHPVVYKLPKGIEAKVVKNTHLSLSGADKVLLGRVAAEIRAYRPPEPYQGKGVRYSDENIIRKQGKAAAK